MVKARILVILLILCATAEAEQLPYRQFQTRIDGNLSEWQPPWLEASIVEFEGSPTQRNRVLIRSCWDLEGLLFAIEVSDSDQVLAPPGLDVDRFHQYDSLQIYLDALADAGPRMNDDDVNLLLLPDGRFGALRGDQLIGALSGATVPQRAGAPLQVEYATNTDQRGWQLELRVPFAGLGLKPMAGLRLGVDVAANDWLIDHPPGASGALTPETVKQLANRAIIPPSPDPAVGTQLLPRSWTGANDFGYPDRWRTLQLTGGPPLSERLVRVLGAKVLVWAGLLSLCCLSGAAWIHLWHRKRLRDLLRRLPAVADAVPEAPPEQIPEHALEEDSALDPREREFADQVLKHVRGNLADSLSPAELAAQFHVSVRTLQRRLKSGLGTSPQDLVLAARLDAARALLKEGRLRISEVAARVGFDDPSHFSRRYRQAFGHAPSDEH